MIDEYWTFIFYGYHSDELKPMAARPIVAQCDECCRYRILRKADYSSICKHCAGRKRIHTNKTKLKISVANTGRRHTTIAKSKMSESHKNLSADMRYNISNSHGTVTDDTKRRISASWQGIPYEEWTGFISNGEYCEKFDDACRERIRVKYNYRCFICDLPQKLNGRKLNVHHADMNKNQGCDGVLWKLVPLCNRCHGKSHHEPMKSRIEYLLRTTIV